MTELYYYDRMRIFGRKSVASKATDYEISTNFAILACHSFGPE